MHLGKWYFTKMVPTVITHWCWSNLIPIVIVIVIVIICVGQLCSHINNYSCFVEEMLLLFKFTCVGVKLILYLIFHILKQILYLVFSHLEQILYLIIFTVWTNFVFGISHFDEEQNCIWYFHILNKFCIWYFHILIKFCFRYFHILNNCSFLDISCCWHFSKSSKYPIEVPAVERSAMWC